MMIQGLLLVFVMVVLIRIVSQYRHRAITLRELMVWVLFWALVATAIGMPQKTDIIASWLGVERGADLLVYVSILVLFFALFRLHLQLRKVDRDLTRLVRNLALHDHDQQ